MGSWNYSETVMSSASIFWYWLPLMLLRKILRCHYCYSLLLNLSLYSICHDRAFFSQGLTVWNQHRVASYRTLTLLIQERLCGIFQLRTKIFHHALVHLVTRTAPQGHMDRSHRCENWTLRIHWSIWLEETFQSIYSSLQMNLWERGGNIIIVIILIIIIFCFFFYVLFAHKGQGVPW